MFWVVSLKYGREHSEFDDTTIFKCLLVQNSPRPLNAVNLRPQENPEADGRRPQIPLDAGMSYM